MPSLSLNPFTGKHPPFALFEIRLDNDFLVFRGNEHESAGQLLRGEVVLCLQAPLKVDEIRLRLTGHLRLYWTDNRVTPTGLATQKVDQTIPIMNHRWAPFVGGPPTSKATVLPAGNYEWPFELLLNGDTSESIEGLPEANITYKLKATIARGKLAHDYSTYKQLRIIRTLQSSALEFLHAMSVENIWPNKVEYSIMVPEKAVVFGSSIPLESRFTPLLKGLELGDITIKLVEVQEVILPHAQGHSVREFKKEREAANWAVSVTRAEHWQDMIEDTGQEGWVVKSNLKLPKKLGKCIQDVNVRGIKVRHKLKLVVALNNPDGHVSELRATLPVTIFISPNMPLDEAGNLVSQQPHSPNAEAASQPVAPPGYGEHVLDQLYEDIDTSGLQTPGIHSGMNSPHFPYAHSRAGSVENLTDMAGVPPAALSSRLQDVSVEPPQDSAQGSAGASGSGGHNTPPAPHLSVITATSQPRSEPLSRHNSGEGSSGHSTPEHVDFADLSKVPSYATAVRTPLRANAFVEGTQLPDYMAATSAPTSPGAAGADMPDPMLSAISEGTVTPTSRNTSPNGQRLGMGQRRISSSWRTLAHGHLHGDSDERRRFHLSHERGRVA